MEHSTRISLKLLLKLQFKGLLLVIVCFIFSSGAKATIQFVDSLRPPPGFEPIHTSQHLRVSVLFLNQPIGFFYVDLYQGRLKFQAPQQVLAQLKGINKKKVRHLLEQSFPLNIECLSNGFAALPSACQRLRQDPIYLIYNPEQDRVYLFLSPVNFEKPNKLSQIDFIPRSTVGLSYLNKLGAAGSFSSQRPWLLSTVYPSTPNYYNLYSNNVLAYENSSLIANLSQNNGINNGQHFQVQNLFMQHIARDKIYAGGYLVNPTSPFFQTQIIAGLGVKTTLDTVKNAERLMATPLVLFIPQASQISIFKNEQLIYSQYLAAGYQDIDTSGFPDGGYELLIKIGDSQIIRRFFNKGFVLPPLKAPQFYLIGGYLTNGMILNDNGYNFLPRVLHVPVLQAGLNQRVTERLAFMGDVLLDSRQGLLDLGPVFFWRNAFVKTAVLMSTKNNYGFYTLFNVQQNRINLSLVGTKILYKDKRPIYYFLNNLIDNDSASISYRVSQNDLVGVQANYNKSLAQPNYYGAGTFYQRQIGSYKGMGFFFNAAYNRAIQLGSSYYLSLSMNFSQGKFAGTEALLGQNQNKNILNDPLAAPLVLQGGTVYSNQNDIGLGYSVNETHTFSSRVSSLAGIYNNTTPDGFISAYANYNSTQGEGKSLGYGGSLETELAMNHYGLHFNGLDRSKTAGIIVRLVSSTLADETALFALLDEHHRKIALIPLNEQVFISLPGFTDQNYTLINLSKADYYIQSPTQHMTLYPGNVGYYTWRVEKRIIIIARAVSAGDHHPLVNHWIHVGNNGIYSDEEGYFQLEVSQHVKSLVVEGPEGCEMKLPSLSGDKDYVYLGDVSCT